LLPELGKDKAKAKVSDKREPIRCTNKNQNEKRQNENKNKKISFIFSMWPQAHSMPSKKTCQTSPLNVVV